MTSNYTDQDLEILIATVNQDALDFLIPMFPFAHFSNFSILIVNQTANEKLLVSDFPSVRVINSSEKGLSRSRNLAIRNASKKIVLITDDDVIFHHGFDTEIVTAFNATNDSIITFNHQRIGLQKPQNPSLVIYNHNYKTIWDVCSIEIAFKVQEVKQKQLFFDEDFGLGSYFETAEELLFLRNALKLKMAASYHPAVIVSHPLLSSGEDQGSDKLVFARAALSYKLRKTLTYIWLPKYLWFLWSYKFIKSGQIINKFKFGLAGIKKFKQLKRRK